MTTAAAIVNQALALGDNQAFCSGTPGSFTDGTTQNVTGAAANILYPIARDTLLRQLNPEFARVTVAGATQAVVTPVVPWSYEYEYPTDAVRIRQVRPPKTGTGSLADPNDPQPIRAAVAYDPVPSAKVVLANQQNALLVYTSNIVGEALWDASFVQAMTRMLANPLTMALAGRPDFARELLVESEQFASIAAENLEL